MTRAVRAKVGLGSRLAVVVMAVAFIMTRPNLLGEQNTNTGLLLSGFALFLILANDKASTRWSSASTVVIVTMFVAILWTLIRAQSIGRDAELIAAGGLAMMVTLTAVGALISDHARARMVARIFVVVIAALSASSAVTAAMTVAGAQFSYLTFPVQEQIIGTIYFPFTPTAGNQSAFGILFPRFTGIGREPGWAAMYAAVAWFLWPRVMPNNRWSALGRASLLFGIVTPFSTSGFGVFVVVLAYEIFLRPRPEQHLATALLRKAVGLGVIALATWIAIAAPVFGLAAKGEQNGLSLDERNIVTESGLEALARLSLGEPAEYERVPNINMIASVTENGWPYLLLITITILAPLAATQNRRFAFAPVLVVFFTLLLAQPPVGSIGAYVMIMLACAVAERRDGLLPEVNVIEVDSRRAGLVRPGERQKHLSRGARH